nr:type II toxin-antitoxin system ParD family antitoxin [Rhizobium sp. Q54]
MPTRNVVLTDHHQEMIDRLVSTGRYQNASEVLRDGLRLVEQRERIETAKLQALTEAAKVGFSDLDADRFRDVNADHLEDFIAGLGEQVERLTAEGTSSR